MTLTVTPASDIGINLDAIDAAAARLAEAVRTGASCRWCAARALLLEIRDYGQERCTHTAAAQGLIVRAEGVLADEPPGNTKCRACRGRRAEARRGRGDVACVVHATCQAHSSGATH